MSTNYKSTARITSETNTKPHYIAMAGIHGCMPGYCDVYPTEESAIDSLIDIHELSKGRAATLREFGYVELNMEQHSNEYAEVVSCDCDDPAQHSDSGIDDCDLPEFQDTDSALRALENAIPDSDPFWEKLNRAIAMQEQNSKIIANYIRYGGTNLPYTARDFAHKHGIRITRENLPHGEPKEPQWNREYFNAAVSIKQRDNSYKKLFAIQFSPSPLTGILNDLYDNILGFLYYYTDYTEDGGSDQGERENIALTHKFLSAISSEARHEFINGWIDFLA